MFAPKFVKTILKQKFIYFQYYHFIMKNFLLLLCSFVALNTFSQQKISFDYDASGNQIKRWWCSNCHSKNSNPKSIEQLNSEDLVKFDEQDLFSYYPNPVKEELYLKWQSTKVEEVIQSIKIYNSNGSLLKTIETSVSTNFQTISFQSYPTGIYFLELGYSKGSSKSIKIIKQ